MDDCAAAAAMYHPEGPSYESLMGCLVGILIEWVVRLIDIIWPDTMRL
jgi:hypothetical protein